MTRNVSKIFRNISYLTGAQLLSSIFGFLTLAILSRVLGPALLGILGFGTAVIGFLGIFTTLGSDQLGAREIARTPNNAGTITFGLISLRLALATGAYGTLILFNHITGRGELESEVLLIQGLGVFITAFTLDYLFQGMRRLEWVALRQVTTAGLILGATILLIRDTGDLIAAAWVYISAGGFVVLFILMKGIFVVSIQRIQFTMSNWRILFTSMLPIAISGTMQAIILNTDLVMLGLLRTHEEVGLYTAVVRIAMLVLVPAGLIITVLFPELARHAENQEHRLKSTRYYITTLLFIGLPLPCIVIMQPDVVLKIIFGDGFLGGINVLTIMMLTTMVTHLRMMFDTPLITWSLENPVMKVSVAGALTNVILNAALIPSLGMIGAVTASLVSQLVMMLGFGWLFCAHTNWVPYMEIIRACICAAFAYFLTLATLDIPQLTDISPTFQLIVSVTIFGGIYLISNLILVWHQLGTFSLKNYLYR
mgnify:CR=1 FL=1